MTQNFETVVPLFCNPFTTEISKLYTESPSLHRTKSFGKVGLDFISAGCLGEAARNIILFRDTLVTRGSMERKVRALNKEEKMGDQDRTSRKCKSGIKLKKTQKTKH